MRTARLRPARSSGARWKAAKSGWSVVPSQGESVSAAHPGADWEIRNAAASDVGCQAVRPAVNRYWTGPNAPEQRSIDERSVGDAAELVAEAVRVKTWRYGADVAHETVLAIVVRAVPSLDLRRSYARAASASRKL